MFPGSQNHTQLRTIRLNEDLIQLWSLQRLGIYMSVYLSIHLSACLSIHLFIYPSIYLPIYPSVCLFIYLSVLCVQSCLSLQPPGLRSLPDYSVHGILQARILEQVAISYSRNLSSPGIKPVSPAMGGRIFTTSRLGSTPFLLDASILTAWRVYIIIWIWGFSWSMGRSVLICLMTITYRSQLIAAPFQKSIYWPGPLFLLSGCFPLICPAQAPGGICFYYFCFNFCTVQSLLPLGRFKVRWIWIQIFSLTSYQLWDFCVSQFPSVGWFSLCTHLQNENVSRYSLEMLRKQYLKEP